MLKHQSWLYAAFLASMFICATAPAAVEPGKQAADFPPGKFTDGNNYDLNEFRGKVVVLFFFEETCPRCRGLVPERNKMVQSLKDKPVKFIAIDPGHTLADATMYARQTHLAMPVYADSLRLMETRWGEHISLENIYQFKVIGPDGKLAAYRPEDIERLAADAKWKYKDKGYNRKLSGAVDAFEWNQYSSGHVAAQADAPRP
ncbi:MAG TPA: TlpA disulfide reductase family protein [Tepidisphaeraceae bacterium]|nr:TlpA disulfide reductase family protein [Tepidisphaeraceae bacterium]